MDSSERDGEARERVIVLDTETTGRSHAQGDRLVEIGCVEVVGNMETGVTWHTYLNPAGRKVEDGARQVHGLTDEFLADKPKFRSVYREFFAFVGNSPLVIHNAPFDMGFINAERLLVGLDPMKNEVRDTLRLARLRYPGQRATLDALCSRLGVDNSGRDLHGALVDASLLAQVYVKMMGLDRLALEGAPEGDAPSRALASEIAILIPRPARPARPAQLPTAEEATLFASFIEKDVKDSIWGRTHAQIG